MFRNYTTAQYRFESAKVPSCLTYTFRQLRNTELYTSWESIAGGRAYTDPCVPPQGEIVAKLRLTSERSPERHRSSLGKETQKETTFAIRARRTPLRPQHKDD